jgi:hypothetical protein
VTARPNPTGVVVDPDSGIPDLIRRLTDDTKRLANDELRLAKMEATDGLHAAMKGTLWLAVGFGAGVVTLVAVTVLLVAGLGELLGNYWAGALAAGLLELVVGALLLRRGLGAYRTPAYTLPATRAQLKETAQWVRQPRAD